MAGGASFACFCQSNPDFNLRDQLFNTEYKTLSESIKPVINCPKIFMNAMQAIFRNRVILIVTWNIEIFWPIEGCRPCLFIL